MVFAAIDCLPDEFSFFDLLHACPGISFTTLKRGLNELKLNQVIKTVGKGRDAKYRK